MPRAEESRIPVSMGGGGSGGGSGSGFRRSQSMRLRGEKYREIIHHSEGDRRRSPPTTILEAPEALVAPEASNGPVQNGTIPNHTHNHVHQNGDLKNRQRSMSLNLNQKVHANGRLARTPIKSPSPLKAFPKNLSLPPRHLENPSTPPVSPEDIPDSHLEDDLESLHSYSSMATTASCDHAYVARNGTTFSGRKMKYVVHCSAHAGQTGQEYLTPTQRAQKQIRRLKALLNQAKLDLEKKDSDIFRLTKEVVELRLYKASLVSPDEKSNSSDAVTVKENTIDDDVQTPDSPCVADLTDDGPIKSYEMKMNNVDFRNHQMPSCSANYSDLHSSLADSGHFEDLTNSSVHSKDDILHDKSCCQDHMEKEDERRKLIAMFERKIDDMSRRQIDETQEMKKAHNDKVEAILQKLADVNTRYCQIMPDYEQAKERIRELEKQLEEVSKQLAEQEEKQHNMYLQMYKKENETSSMSTSTHSMELSSASTSRVSVSELLQELQITQKELDNIRDMSYSPERTSSKSRVLLSAKEAVSLWVLGARKAMYKRIMEAQAESKKGADPEVTLQFLKSAIYYFLTDRENNQGHLRAIESILGFTEAEKEHIEKARNS